MIDDETKIMCLTKISQKAKTMNLLVRFLPEMQPAVLSSLWNQRLRRAALSASRLVRLTFEPGDMCYF